MEMTPAKPAKQKYLKPGYYCCPPTYAATVYIDKDQAIHYHTKGNTIERCPMCGAGYVFNCYCGFIEILS